jgi:DNA polymerase-3 subunit alpha (Gram-positive type)
MDEYIAIDLEMTGLKVKTDRILEIGAVKIKGNQLEDTFQTFVNPHRKLDGEITKLTGITDEMVADAPDAKDAFLAFLEFSQDLALIGHNVMFDYSFLKQCAVNCDVDFERPVIDTLKIARKLLVEPEKKSLASLCTYFQIEQRNAHRALDDAISAAKLFLCLKECHGESNPEIFVPKPVKYKVKKQGPLTPAQKRDLNHLMIYHRIEFDIEIDSLTKSEASRLIDRIYATYGRIPDQEA